MSDPISLVLLCIDYRFWPEALPLLEKHYGQFDLIELAGASKNLVSPMEEADRTALIENIALSISLHHPKQLILTNHTDCGMYGNSKDFATPEEETAFQSEELRKAKAVINENFSDLRVVTVLVDRDENKEIFLRETA